MQRIALALDWHTSTVPKVLSSATRPTLPWQADPPPQALTKSEREAIRREEERQRRLYRVGLSYRCGRCGKPKKGHVCDIPDGEEGAYEDEGLQPRMPQPILANVVKAGSSTLNSGGR